MSRTCARSCPDDVSVVHHGRHPRRPEGAPPLSCRASAAPPIARPPRAPAASAGLRPEPLRLRMAASRDGPTSWRSGSTTWGRPPSVTRCTGSRASASGPSRCRSRATCSSSSTCRPSSAGAPYAELTAAQWEAILRRLASAGAQAHRRGDGGLGRARRAHRALSREVPGPGARASRRARARAPRDRQPRLHPLRGGGRALPPAPLLGQSPVPSRVLRLAARARRIASTSAAAQDILGSWFGVRPRTLVPARQRPLAEDGGRRRGTWGSATSRASAPPRGRRRRHHLSSTTHGCSPFHDRDVVLRGTGYVSAPASGAAGARFVTVGELGELQEARRAI